MNETHNAPAYRPNASLRFIVHYDNERSHDPETGRPYRGRLASLVMAYNAIKMGA